MTGEIMTLEGLGGLLNPRKRRKSKGGKRSRRFGGFKAKRNPGRKTSRRIGGGLVGTAKALGVGILAGMAAEAVNAGVAKLSAKYPAIPFGGRMGHLVNGAAAVAAYYGAKRFAPKYASLIPTAFGAVIGAKLAANDVPRVADFIQGAYAEAAAAHGSGGGAVAGLGMLVNDRGELAGVGQADANDYL